MIIPADFVERQMARNNARPCYVERLLRNGENKDDVRASAGDGERAMTSRVGVARIGSAGDGTISLRILEFFLKASVSAQTAQTNRINARSPNQTVSLLPCG